MRSTIRDVASKAGVSIATVSRALRDPRIVSPETQHKVARAAAELEYVPSHLGRQLAERRHAANGIVFPDLSGPYFAEVVLGYEDVAAELGRSVLHPLHPRTRGRAGDGHPTSPAAATASSSSAARSPTRCCTASGRAAASPLVLARPHRRSPAIDSLNAENRATAPARSPTTWSRRAPGPSPSSATRPPPPTSPSGSRASQAGAAAAGADVHVQPTPELDEHVGRPRAADAVLKSGALPDAFACANDELALGLMTELRAGGVVVPDDVLVSGWDDVMAARYAGLTTVRQPMRDLGATAARMLDELISRPADEPAPRGARHRSDHPHQHHHPRKVPPDESDPIRPPRARLPCSPSPASR